ncbi:MAG TPA: DUF4019 domain-containing protein [Deltaproteobacteria bacterium]|jgi:hypothetical protein|nr:DUF4019 domain-containing protein [Deltaproteobacteria bacterium]HRW80466.1 DUF4019 domain-containing protein [Desulfomonilia bacterium]HNS88736.1 DUF4019 domain-containing protein [Deltaproteobacteria bacterium]HOA43588.1 DUF4019 domain-containing protein [Deltaproteobacteria bacterium]HOC74975.1 DUF4019 domain-containing protein [Deltaproteobacteria bacterium]
MFRNVLTGLMAACIMLAGTTLPAAEPIEGKAVEAALQWLALVDKGDYAGSLKESADYFKGAIREEQWKQAMEGVRGPLGKALGRTLKTAEHRTSLPGAPDGDYVVIQFETSFENKGSAVETVTSMLEKDGTWRVAGYYIN